MNRRGFAKSMAAASVATMVRPDILVIDEALSAGDMAFQKKCVQRMNEFRQQQKTMVFCSHSMFHVQELCDTAIWLDKGKIREMGDSDKVVEQHGIKVLVDKKDTKF